MTPYRVTTHMKATEQDFHVVRFKLLCKEIRTSKAVDNQSFAQFFRVVLFIMLYRVVLPFKSVDETLVCDHSNKS